MLQPAALFIALGNLFHAMGHSSFDAYFALFAQEHNVGDHIIGFGWGIGVTAEVIIMRIAPSFLREHRPTVFLMLGSGAAAFRWAMMYYLNDPVEASGCNRCTHSPSASGIWRSQIGYRTGSRLTSERPAKGSFLAVMSLGMASGNLSVDRLFRLPMFEVCMVLRFYQR